MKEKLLCVLEKHPDEIVESPCIYGTYILSVNDLKIILEKKSEVSYKKYYDSFWLWLFTSKEKSAIYTNYYCVYVVGGVERYTITKEEYDNILNIKKENKDKKILEKLNNLCQNKKK